MQPRELYFTTFSLPHAAMNGDSAVLTVSFSRTKKLLQSPNNAIVTAKLLCNRSIGVVDCCQLQKGCTRVGLSVYTNIPCSTVMHT